MGIFERVRGLVRDNETPGIGLETTEYVAANPQSTGGKLTPGESIEVPIRVVGGETRRTVEGVDLELIHVTGTEERTPLVERRVSGGFPVDPFEERALTPSFEVPENAPRSGELPTRLRASLRVADAPDDEFTAYVDIGPNPLLTAVRTELRMLGFSLTDTEVVDRPDDAFWPDAALEDEFLLSMSFAPDDGESAFALVPVPRRDVLDCYLERPEGDGWERVVIDDRDAPAERLAGTLDRLGLRG